jgi:hypothetical protein
LRVEHNALAAELEPAPVMLAIVDRRTRLAINRSAGTRQSPAWPTPAGRRR